MDTKTEPRKLPQESLPAPLPSYADEQGVPRHGGYWNGFGWEGHCVDVAIGADSPDAMQWCHDMGFIDHSTKTFFNTPVRALCEQRAPGCAKVLKRLGYPT